MKRFQGRIPLVNTFGKASLHPVDGTPFLGEAFEADFGAGLLPFAVGQFCFQRGEFSFGRTDEVANPHFSHCGGKPRL